MIFVWEGGSLPFYGIVINTSSDESFFRQVSAPECAAVPCGLLDRQTDHGRRILATWRTMLLGGAMQKRKNKARKMEGRCCVITLFARNQVASEVVWAMFAENDKAAVIPTYSMTIIIVLR